MNRQERSRRIVEAAEVQAAAAFGVSVMDLRGGDRSIAEVLARRAAATAAKEMGLSWPALQAAVESARGEPASLSTLRRQREDLLRDMTPPVPSAFSRALERIYEDILAHLRMAVGGLAA